MKHIIMILAMGMVAIITSACIGVVGNGEVITEVRDVQGFTEVRFEGAGQVNITRADTYSLEIEAESNIMPLLISRVDGDTLILESVSQPFSATRPVRYRITMPALTVFDSSGAGEVTIGAFEGETLRIESSGAGSITVESLTYETLDVEMSGAVSLSVDGGSVAAQSVSVSGTGNYEAAALESQTAVVDLSGTGSITINVSERISGDLSGVGTLRYTGDASVNVETSGASSVRQLD